MFALWCALHFICKQVQHKKHNTIKIIEIQYKCLYCFILYVQWISQKVLGIVSNFICTNTGLKN